MGDTLRELEEIGHQREEVTRERESIHSQSVLLGDLRQSDLVTVSDAIVRLEHLIAWLDRLGKKVDQLQDRLDHIASGASASESASPPRAAGHPGIEPPSIHAPHIAPVRMSSASLLKVIGPSMKKQLIERSYNRAGFLAGFLEFYDEQKSSNPSITAIEAFRQFGIDTSARLGPLGGGHCAALSKEIMAQTGMGFLCPSTLPSAYQQKNAPKICHAATLVPFANPEDDSDKGFLVIDPGFNFPGPVRVLLDGSASTISSGNETWEFHFDVKDQAVVGYEVTKKDKKADHLILFTTEIDNPDNAITLPLMCVDMRPCILARSDTGDVVAKLIIDLRTTEAGQNVQITISGQRSKYSFADVLREDAWASEALATLLRLRRVDLVRHVRQIINGQAVLQALREARVAKTL